MSAGHTPGPWAVVPSVRFGSFDGKTTVASYGISNGSEWVCAIPCYAANTEPSAANARLIAAAPDLLAACEALLASHKYGDGVGWQHARDKARAAIAKATQP